MAESLKGKTAYDKNSKRYLNITNHQAISIGSTNVSNSIVDKPEFVSIFFQYLGGR